MGLSATVPIVTDDSLAEGLLEGYSEAGNLIVAMRYMPVFQRLVGDAGMEQYVAQWHVSTSGARRIAAIGAWNSMEDPEHPTMGNA